MACRALGNIGAEAKSAIPRLTEAAGDPDLSVRLVAAFALQKIDPQGRASEKSAPPPERPNRRCVKP